ncbi:helicase HerA-like domain-containing protein [Iodidimonas sp. SYSU 1G8]|uniref:helicase HerA-like domain-containing protein n=1 Tax=Iodidimonas sp. SYSU 1G8 TaxID=3133967 RepID=UPI0031FF0229
MSLLRANSIYLGTGQAPQYLSLKRANRHGLIAGATGTGKTVSLQILAEGFSRAGVPVFLADAKGDLSGICQPGAPKDFLLRRATEIGLDDYQFDAFPAVYWDLFAEQGHPIRATVSEMGPLLLSQLLGLNDTQEGVLNIAFRLADEQGLLLLDLKDLRAILNHIGENAASLTTEYGNVSKASVGSIQRALLALENEGAAGFFGEPALDLHDFIGRAPDGRGLINILAADRLIQSPKTYATFLLWLLSELFEELPEVGDPDKPVLVFFFDEAHLLFRDAPKVLLDKVAQVVRLVRSKGIGVYFVTQSPDDIPDDVLGQLGNRVQHALRAFTPRDAAAVRTAAQTFRQNPAFDTAAAITELAVGEALVSTLDGKGIPTMVDRTMIRPPQSRLGPATPQERQQAMMASPVAGRYDNVRDRDSAYEMLVRRARSPEAGAAGNSKGAGQTRTTSVPRSGGRQRQGVGETFAKSIASSVGRELGRALLRGLMGSLRRR